MNFFTADWLIGNEALGPQEPVGRDAQTGTVVEPASAPPLVVPQPEVLLQTLVVALDAPALVGGVDQFIERRVLGQRGQGVFARLRLMGRPLDEQPLKRA